MTDAVTVSLNEDYDTEYRTMDLRWNNGTLEQRFEIHEMGTKNGWPWCVLYREEWRAIPIVGTAE